jgi:amino acid transporter
VSGVIIISIVILATSDGYNSGEWVFTNFANEVGYSNGVAWMLGLLQSALSLIGYDVVMHMTEEMPRPRRDAPHAIVLSIIVGGTTYVYRFRVASLPKILPVLLYFIIRA